MLPALLATAVSTALAHPVPETRAVLRLAESGSFELRIGCDVAALVMNATPGHLGADGVRELQSLSESELAARIDDARRSLEYHLQLQFDGVRIVPKAEFPLPAALRMAAAHGEGSEHEQQEIVLRGEWPPAAATVDLAFPAALGRVRLELWRGKSRLVSRRLSPGEKAAAIDLQTITTYHDVSLVNYDRVGVVLAAALALYLLWRHWPRGGS